LQDGNKKGKKSKISVDMARREAEYMCAVEQEQGLLSATPNLFSLLLDCPKPSRPKTTQAKSIYYVIM
jgi:hypothetical protein